MGFLTCHFLFSRIIKLANDIGENPGPPNDNDPPTDVPIHICHSNLRSILSDLDSNYKALGNRPPKVIELEAFCEVNSINIMAVTESWCKDDTEDRTINMNGFSKLFRRDRLNRVGGGILLYATDDINIERLQDIEPDESEIMCFEFQLPKKVNKYVFLCVCYRPNDKHIVDFLCDLQDIYDYTADKDYYNFLCVGDFNTKNNAFCNTDISNVEGEILKAILDSNGLHQLVNFPTRFDIHHNRSSCLDYVITNNENFVCNVEGYGPIANSDHIPVGFQINSKIPKIKNFTRHVWNFKKGDFDKLNEKLAQYPWDTIFVVDDLDEIVDIWTDVFISLAKECIPYTKITVRPSDLPYMTCNLRSLIRRKDRLFHQWVRTQRDDHRDHYKKLRNYTSKSLRDARDAYIKKQCDKLEIDNASSNWWDTVKKLCCFKQTSNTIAPIANTDGILVYDAETKADIFNQFYASISTIDNNNDPIPQNNIPLGPLLDNIVISQHDVYVLLSKLDTSKATGPDNIGNMFLKRCAPSISNVLTRIFNLSLSLGHFPRSWKIANIVPIHKKGSVHDFKMYRPVSLLPCVSKVFEKLIFKEVYSHLRRNNLISEFQSGFTPGDSTLNQLIHINDMILKSHDKLDDVLGCFLDLTRAFDTVWHKGLLYKLDRYGIRDHLNGCKLYSWFQSYLDNRGHRVSIDGKVSSIRHINSAVPQGSVLGPLLFLVYINDVTDGIESDIFLFADDTSIFKAGQDTVSMARTINSDLNKIALWAKRWKITINPTKTVSVLFSKRAAPNTNFVVRLNNDIIKLSQNHKHLGLWLSSDGSWKKHIKEIATKARKRLGCITKHKYRLTRRSTEILYLTYVRPVMEYGNVLYDSATQEELEILDNIEKEALRTITGARRRCNLELLYNEVKWPCLSKRRELQKIATLGKIVIKQFPPYLVRDLPTFYSNTRNIRNNTFAIPAARTDYYAKSFVPDSVNLWNKLPPVIRGIKSYKALKSRLKNSSQKSVPKYFYHGDRRLNILHTKLRLKCSDLNQDKFNIGVSDTDRCICGEVETSEHYLLDCGSNLVARIEMLDSVMDILVDKGYSIDDANDKLGVDLLLYGANDLSVEDNALIFEKVQHFIGKSKRFDVTT